jgi:hypothetical protein
VCGGELYAHVGICVCLYAWAHLGVCKCVTVHVFKCTQACEWVCFGVCVPLFMHDAWCRYACLHVCCVCVRACLLRVCKYMCCAYISMIMHMVVFISVLCYGVYMCISRHPLQLVACPTRLFSLGNMKSKCGIIWKVSGLCSWFLSQS